MMHLSRDIPIDPILPQLAAALDSEHMTQVFGCAYEAQRVAADSWSVNSCEIEWVKYKPGRNCLVCYQLTLLDNATGQRRQRRLAGRLYERGGAASRFNKAQHQALMPTASNDFLPVWQIEPLDMLVWPFPNERKLHGLPALIDHATLRWQVMPTLVQAHWGDAWSVADLAVDLMHYAPEHTAVVRATVALNQATTGQHRSWVVFGKTYPDDQGASTLSIMHELWRSPARISSQLQIPQPLSYQSDQRIFWQEGLSGETLRDAYPTGDYRPALLEQITATIAALQQTRLSQATTLEVAELQQRLQARGETLAAALPACRPLLDNVINRLLTQAQSLDRTTRATLHGDLHPQNIFLTKSQVALIDLDNVCQGPPLQDIGSWLAALIYQTRLQGQPLPSLQRQVTAFIAAYRRRVPWPVPTPALQWYTATALINERAFRCLSRLKAGRLELLDELIGLADRISCGEGLSL